MAQKRYLALDPGGTTGWALHAPADSDSNIKLDAYQWNCNQIGPEEHHAPLYAFLEHMNNGDLTVICESFEFRQNRQRDNINLMSREYIGVVKAFGQEYDVPVVFQTAAMAKTFVTDQKLKAMGLWFPGRKHAMDAMRHLVYYLVNKKGRRDLIESWKDL